MNNIQQQVQFQIPTQSQSSQSTISFKQALEYYILLINPNHPVIDSNQKNSIATPMTKLKSTPSNVITSSISNIHTTDFPIFFQDQAPQSSLQLAILLQQFHSKSNKDRPSQTIPIYYDDSYKISYLTAIPTQSPYLPHETAIQYQNQFIDYISNYGDKRLSSYLVHVFSTYIILIPSNIPITEFTNPTIPLTQQDIFNKYLHLGYLVPISLYQESEATHLYEKEKARGFKSELEEAINLKQEQYEQPTHNTPYSPNTNNQDILQFTEKQLKTIESFEHAQGFNFNTTLLKLAIDLKFLTSYQLYLLENFHKYEEHYLTGTRRSGKTFFFVYLAIRQLFLKEQTILYIIPTENFAKQPMMYFQRFLSNITKADKNIRFIRSENAIYNDDTNSVIWFVTAQGLHGVRSQEATLVIVDEASFVPDSEALSAQTMLGQIRSMQEKNIKYISVDPKDPSKTIRIPVGKFVAGSTINLKTPKNWFYQGVNSAESGTMINSDGELEPMPPDFSHSIRVSIHQCPFYSEKEKKILLNKYKDNPEALKAELLAMFPSGNERFELAKVTIDTAINVDINRPIAATEQSRPRIINKQILTSQLYLAPTFYYNNYVQSESGLQVHSNPALYIGYDPAKKQTNSALSLLEVYYNNTTLSQTKSTRLLLIGEMHIPKGTDYFKQAETIKSLVTFMQNEAYSHSFRYDEKSKVKRSYSKILIGLDNTGIGEAVSEMLSKLNIRHHRIQYYGSASQSLAAQFGTKQFGLKNGIYYVNKDYLLDLIPVMANQQRYKAFRLPATYADFEVFNDINLFQQYGSFAKMKSKYSLDFYNASSLALFAAILDNEDIILNETIAHNMSTPFDELKKLLPYTTFRNGVPQFNQNNQNNKNLFNQGQTSASNRYGTFGF